jgi:hypothetical protein
MPSLDSTVPMRLEQIHAKLRKITALAQEPEHNINTHWANLCINYKILTALLSKSNAEAKITETVTKLTTTINDMQKDERIIEIDNLNADLAELLEAIQNEVTNHKTTSPGSSFRNSAK